MTEVELSEDSEAIMIWARIPKADDERSLALLRFVKALRLADHVKTGGIEILARLQANWLEAQRNDQR